MHGQEKRMLLRHYLEKGGSRRALARQLGISRDTLYRWIREGELDRDVDVAPSRYGPRPPAPTKLDSLKPTILARLESYPELTAVRLFEEIQAAGYPGGDCFGSSSSHARTCGRSSRDWRGPSGTSEACPAGSFSTRCGR